jgi:N4-(beta-N-acetylglucosaminyl)-L-asparaginase
MKRRTFLQTSTLLGASLGATAKAASSEPLIIATWKNEKATIAGWNKLMETGKALDGVEAGARIPEADPNDTSVGYGGYPDRDGHVTLDACIMDHVGNAGSVTFLEGIMHPISVARAVMEKTPHVMLSGAGALKFALDQGFKVENLLTETSKKAWEEWKKESKYEPVINIERHDTIGLLGIGKAGEIAGACTTSGLAFKMHGRVGDSPIIGGAVFCDDEVGGACATGLGEFVMKTLGSFLIVELMRQGMSPQKACEEAVMRIVKRYKYKEFQIGYLALNKKGEYGAYAIQKGFNYTITKNGKTQVIESAYYM